MFTRRVYNAPPLLRKSLHDSPLEQLKSWLGETSVDEPNAMCLATATKEGQPSTRTVLLKEIDERGLIFYTNYHSRKAQEIAANPSVSATFLWPDLHRQVTVEGMIEKLSREESDAYFHMRPRGAQLGAMASEVQGKTLESRTQLEEDFYALEKEYHGKEVPLPPYWGGYLIRPNRFEFWQGQPNRLHDRLAFKKEGTGWTLERLAP